MTMILLLYIFKAWEKGFTKPIMAVKWSRVYEKQSNCDRWGFCTGCFILKVEWILYVFLCLTWGQFDLLCPTWRSWSEHLSKIDQPCILLGAERGATSGSHQKQAAVLLVESKSLSRMGATRSGSHGAAETCWSHDTSHPTHIAAMVKFISRNASDSHSLLF